MKLAVFAEFASAHALLAAVERLRAEGYARMEAFTPYPLPALDEKLGIPRSGAPRFVLAAALVGGAGAYVGQWWLSSRLYPIDVGGRPLHSAPAFIPVTFEMTVLAACLTGIVFLFIAGGMPRLWDPVFEVEGIERASIDRFWVAIDAGDPAFDPSRTTALLEELGATRVVAQGGAGEGA